MPYFVYRIKPDVTGLTKQLDLLESFDAFKEAKVYARDLREKETQVGNETIKVIFADNALHAEELLMEKREPRLLDGNEDPI